MQSFVLSYVSMVPCFTPHTPPPPAMELDSKEEKEEWDAAVEGRPQLVYRVGPEKLVTLPLLPILQRGKLRPALIFCKCKGRAGVPRWSCALVSFAAALYPPSFPPLLSPRVGSRLMCKFSAPEHRWMSG